MAQFTIQQLGSVNATVGQEVDPNYGAARMSVKPMDWTGGGHFLVAQASGSIAATLGAGSDLFYFKFAGATANQKAKVFRIAVGVEVNGTVTTAVPFDIGVYKMTNMTTNPSSNQTALTLTGGTNKAATEMAASQSLAWICTTAAMTAASSVGTKETNPLVAAPFPMPVSTTAGAGSGLVEIFKTDKKEGSPLVFALNEGFTIENILAGPATGTFKLFVCVEWAEPIDNNTNRN